MSSRDFDPAGALILIVTGLGVAFFLFLAVGLLIGGGR